MVNIILFLILFLPCRQMHPLNQQKIEISLAERQGVFSDKTILDIVIKSNFDASIDMPDTSCAKFGYKDDSSIDFYFQVFEINDSTEKLVVPTADYQYRFFDSDNCKHKLGSDQSIKYSFDLNSFYTLNSLKKYKARVFFKASKYIADMGEVCSKWLYISR